MTEGAGDSDGEKIFKCEGNSRKNQNQKWSLKMQLHCCQLLTKGYQVSSCFLWAEWSKQLKMEPVSAEDAVRRSSRRFRTSHRHSQEAGRNFRGSRRSSTLGKPLSNSAPYYREIFQEKQSGPMWPASFLTYFKNSSQPPSNQHTA